MNKGLGVFFVCFFHMDNQTADYISQKNVVCVRHHFKIKGRYVTSSWASDSLDTEMLSPVPPGDWYMPRSTKVVKEDFPDAFTKPLD